MSEVFMKRIVVGLFLLAAALTAYAQAAKPSDTLGIGDAVRVTVYQQADLTTDARVTENGTITMPLIGEVKVAGLSAIEAGTQIGDALKSGKFLKNPQVTVAVTTVRSRLILRRPAANGKFVENYVGLLEPVKADDTIYVREALF